MVENIHLTYISLKPAYLPPISFGTVLSLFQNSDFMMLFEI